MKSSFTIIVPVYNEEENLIRLENELVSYVKDALINTSVLFVNDGSTDNSLAFIEDICHRQDTFNYISLKQNSGLSTALKAGFDTVKSDLVGYIDADLQTDPNDFNLLLPYTNNYQLVTGVRLERQDSLIKRLSSKFANGFRKLFTNDGIDDTGCPLKIIHTAYAKRIPMFRGLHRFLPAMILLHNGNVKQVPVKHFPRLAGNSKYSVKNRFFGPFLDCFAYLWMKRKYINYHIDKRS
ncbi:glycosyltransferase involved in cell wall biosynthesis [Winogradskyella wandonensis]|uniref:Glycosyltransferase involved in cell wall biosynthesis n=1 Tax=Winogradskyella wandonensis TaxID=1442586 RepID=A0A4R1KUA9_9FLAO|nr:glycosyltransferase family 2 protein [Winogradskyella wandonensis]TCK68788.1 glycosyltransferase involved in cell wall biosynthesis [Winogradskyella wandonensis]